MNNGNRIGDGPIEDKMLDLMQQLAKGIDAILNGHSSRKVNGFVLQVFPLEGHNGRCNYVSNASREDVIVLMREQLSRFEGMAEQKVGHA